MKNFKKITLGLLGTAILSLGLYACSDEEINNLQQEDVKTAFPVVKNNSELEEDYELILQSSEFSEIMMLLKSFDSKINILEFDDFDNKEGFLETISNNIEQTDFVDFAEAIEHYDLIENKYTIFFAENIDFYINVSNLELQDIRKFVNIDRHYDYPEFIDINDPDIPGGGINNCEGDCIVEMWQCHLDAQQVYEEKIAGAILVGTIFSPVGVAIVVNAYFERKAADKKCAKEGLDCVDNC